MTDDPVSEIARATAARLGPEFGQNLAAKVEAALYARDSSRGPEQFDPVSVGILIVAIVTLAWTVYSEHRKKAPDASAAAVEGTLRNEIRREVEVTPDSIRITEVVVQEIMDRHPGSL